MKLQRVLSAVCAVSLLSVGPGEPFAAAAEGEPTPRLVVLVVVDQLRPDYLTRFGGRFEGGFKRFAEHGVEFSEARHGHAVTTTGPGHAALSTGTHPSRNGIIDNSWFDRASSESVNCVEDRSAPPLEASGSGRSPRNLLREGLADWIKRADPEARVFGVSRKDRGAILPAGLGADAAYWYDSKTGSFISSRHYLSRYPAWVRDFNAEDIPSGYFGRQWDAVEPRPDPEAEREAGIGDLDEGAFARLFPFTLGSATLSPDSDFYGDFGATPFMDDYLERFAEALVTHESLGADDHLDFLSVSFSALDSVGHDFGPNSRQVADTVIRLDQTLGRFFDFLDRRVGRDRYLVALSSDHGVVAVPEFGRGGKAGSARRFNEADRLCIQRAGLRLREILGDEDWFAHGLYLNYEALGKRNLRRSDVERTVASLLMECDAVEAVWTRTQLESGEPGGEFQTRYARSFHPLRSPDLMVQLRESVISTRGRGTTHGSPYEYDVRVPLLIMGAGVTTARKVTVPVLTVDLAPTLAELLGVARPDDLDGVSRADLLRRGAEATQ